MEPQEIQHAINSELRTKLGLTFVTEAEDHCETTLEAFADVKPVIDAVARALHKAPADVLYL